MFIIKWILIVIIGLVVLLVLAGQLGLLRGKAPADLGVRDGKLKRPSLTPNSVTSQAEHYPDHPRRDYARIAPLPLQGDATATLARIKTLVEKMPGAAVIESRADYLYAQFTTPLLKFVDDVEFWADPATGAIQVRSASRIGHGDRGLNRARIEGIRAALTAL